MRDEPFSDPTQGRSAGLPESALEDPTRGRSAGTVVANELQDPTREHRGAA
ncbi:MAG: hypothetical protein ACRDMX_16050 [Solirubrobacteraceae bacterium]